MEIAGTGDIHIVYHRVNVELQIRKLDEEDGRCRLVHSLRMTRIHTVG